ncbi:ATP-binding protein [Nonomuraea sp. 3N208]|uniref:ATP-binding protein n=1 Tax=Nonomuraea sp. 3N208 TaxID=3457421 RepID=UPI003FD35C14
MKPACSTFLGPPGVGKTMLAIGLAVAACRAGYTVYFTTLDDMVRQLKAADAIGRLAAKMKTYTRPDVLVLDEVGYLPLDRADANLVFQTISKRYETGSILLTSNKASPDGWTKTFTDPRLCAAIVDRLTYDATIIETGTDSYRLAHSRAQQGTPA